MLLPVSFLLLLYKSFSVCLSLYLIILSKQRFSIKHVEILGKRWICNTFKQNIKTQRNSFNQLFLLNLISLDEFLTLSLPVTSAVTCIYPLSGLTVICLNAFQPLTCSNTPLRMRRKKRIFEVNGVKTVCFLLHQKKSLEAAFMLMSNGWHLYHIMVHGSFWGCRVEKYQLVSE